MKHFNITISGKVQGVFYRQSTSEKAKLLNLNGFVCNQPDGSVYAEAEGEESRLQELIEWCRNGPPRARVVNVAYEESELKNYSGFDIRR
ncbi:MAG TPA: acylphosphatase [Bacteroidia bacterium]